MADIKLGSTTGGKVIATVDEIVGKAQAIKTPTPIAPLTGTENVGLTATLEASTFLSAYTGDTRLHRVFQLSDDSGFANIVFTSSIDANSVAVSPELEISTGYWWRCKDISVTGEESDWSEVQAFTTGNVFIVTPTVTVEGSPDDVSETPTLTGSAFSVSGGSDTHTSSDWEVRRVSDDVLVWSSIADTVNLESVVVEAGYLAVDTAYKFRVKYNGATYTSAFGETQATTQAEFFFPDPSNVGVPYEGGYYAGQIKIGNYVYPLVVAPRSQGGLSSAPRQWKTSNTDTPNTNSGVDGASNTAAMIAAGAASHPAADFCNSLNINGYTDWYLPAKDELEICYRYLKPTTEANYTSSGSNANAIPATGNYTAGNPAQTSVTIFKTGNSEAFRTDSTTVYWSSTQDSATSAWTQHFTNGFQNNGGKTPTYWVRAVRKVMPQPPAEVGAAYEGGYYAGMIGIDGVAYALVVAPRSQGGLSTNTLQWKTANTDTTGTDSLNDGAANTAAMIAAGAASHPAADFCNSLNINGYTDWYFPARDELEICYRYLKPTTDANSTSNGSNANAIPATGNYTAGNPAQTSVTIFQTGNSEAFRTDSTWSSTQDSATSACIQFFANGNQIYGSGKANPYWVRAVRKVAI